MKKKRIYLTTAKTKWCWVYLFRDKAQMRTAYKHFRPKDQDHNDVLGVHCGYVAYHSSDPEGTCRPETGRVYLCVDHCGAGVVSHELLHAVLWAWKHGPYKQQYPIVISSMEEEEELLHNHTYAVNQFYTWYWDIEGTLRAPEPCEPPTAAEYFTP